MSGNIQTAANLYQQGKLAEAEKNCKLLLQSNPSDFNALHLLGVISYQAGEYYTAIEYLLKASTLAKNNIAVKHALAASYQNTKQLSEAIHLYEELIENTPENLDFHIQLAHAFEENEQFDKALKILNKIFPKTPMQSSLLNDIGRILYKNNQFEQADETLSKCVQQEPGNASTWNLLGLCKIKLMDNESARNCFTKSIQIDLHQLPAHLNLALLLQDIGEYEESEKHYLHVIEQSSDITNEISQASYNLALIYLGQGRFSEAWEYLLKRPKTFTDIPDRSKLKGKRVLVCGEEGLGDELTFLRFIPELAKTGAIINYVCNPKLSPLLRNSDSINQVYVPNDNIPKHDYTISIMDLPYILQLNQIDQTTPFILPTPTVSNDDTIGQIALKKNDKPILGITWRAGQLDNDPVTNKYLVKNIPIAEICNMLSEFDGTIVILQRNPQKEEIDYITNKLDAEIIDASHLNQDLAKMLCALQYVDHYIGVSNTNMHLYGTLGKNACVIIPYPGEWRWLYSGKSSPWYPDFHLIRQQNANSLQDVQHQVKEYLLSI